MADFTYTELLPLGPDATHVPPARRRGRVHGRGRRPHVPPGRARGAHRAGRRGHARHRPLPAARATWPSCARILDDPEASANDRFVALDLLKNANISAGGVLPMCQDTGTAIVKGKKGQFVLTGGGDEAAIARGIFDTYQTRQPALLADGAARPCGTRVNTGTNLPAEIKISAVDGDAYKFLFMAKGGGSANKSYLFQETKALLNPDEPARVPRREAAHARHRGLPAVPPGRRHRRHVGRDRRSRRPSWPRPATSTPCPPRAASAGHGFRDLELEAEVLALTQAFGIGAQFGGKYFCHDVRVIRLPRHGASCPVGIAVSCSADRQALAKITADGVFLEQLERDPAQYLPEVTDDDLGGDVVQIDLEPADGRDPRRAQPSTR